MPPIWCLVSADFAALANNVHPPSRASLRSKQIRFSLVYRRRLSKRSCDRWASLGKLPSWITLDFVNIVAEGGYSVGDTVKRRPIAARYYGAHGITVSKTTTNVIVIFSSGGIYINQKDGWGALPDEPDKMADDSEG